MGNYICKIYSPQKQTPYSMYVVCIYAVIQETQNRTVGERVLGSAEDVALLLIATLDNNNTNGTVSRNITRDNISKYLAM